MGWVSRSNLGGTVKRPIYEAFKPPKLSLSVNSYTNT